MELRQKLGLLVLENESEAAGLVRITLDQERRTAQRLEGQIKTAKERAPKRPRIPKMKVPRIKKPKATAKPRKRKVKHEMDTQNITPQGTPRSLNMSDYCFDCHGPPDAPRCTVCGDFGMVNWDFNQIKDEYSCGKLRCMEQLAAFRTLRGQKNADEELAVALRIVRKTQEGHGNHGHNRM